MNAISPTRRQTVASGEIIERISLRVITPTFGTASVRFESVHLRHLLIEVRPEGKLRIRAPKVKSRSGIELGEAYHLQPGVREAVEQAIALLWARATDAGNER